MCGISGILSQKRQNGNTIDIVKNMVNTLRHRGPDERGIYVDDQICMGQARLSIIDPEGGIQPIHNEDESLWLVCNGEIFNYIELWKELE